MSDILFIEIGFDQLTFVPKIFFIQKSGKLTGIAVKIVDDVQFSGNSDLILSTIKLFESKFKLGTVVYGPGSFLFYSMDSKFHCQMILTCQMMVKKRFLHFKLTFCLEIEERKLETS